MHLISLNNCCASLHYCSLTTSNLRFLSIDQNLADIAHFITTIKDLPKFRNSKVVLVGGSYAGTMATWFRQKYPHLAVGAWASSAPLFGRFDFKEYKEVVGQSIKLVGGEKCHETLRQGFAMTEHLVASGQIARLRELFGLCDEFDASYNYNIWNFFAILTNIPASFVQGHPVKRIEEFCAMILTSEEGAAEGSMERDARVLQTFANVMKTHLLSPIESCLALNYADTLVSFKHAHPRFGVRQWLYQTCSEFGWAQTLSSDDQPFGTQFPIELDARRCHDMYDGM